MPLASLGSLPRKLVRYVIVGRPVDDASGESCAICTFDLKDEGMYDDDGDTGRTWSSLIDCGHTFHGKCLEELTAKFSDHIRCPYCKMIYGEIVGTQPKNGNMKTWTDNNIALPGFPAGTKTIVVQYSFKNGVQGPEHPNPGT